MDLFSYQVPFLESKLFAGPKAPVWLGLDYLPVRVLKFRETVTVFVYDLLLQQGDDVSGWESLDWVTGISRDGLVISGIGTNASGDQEGFVARINLSAVPEPGSAAMIAVCLSCFVFFRRRKV